MNNPPIDKVALSVSNPSLAESIRIEAEKKTAEMKKKGITTIFAKASIVPIGLYAFSKYNKYDTKKTIKVTIIGSVVILGAVWVNGMSGAWTGVTIADKLFGKIKKSNLPTIPQIPTKPYMPEVNQGTPEEQKAFHDSLVKSMPNNFTLKLSTNSNVYYYKNSNNEFYKQPFIPNSYSGVQPIKISVAEYSDAYIKFKNK